MNAVMSWIVQRRIAGLMFFGGLAVVIAGSSSLGWIVGRAPLQVQLANLKTTHATEKAQLAKHAAKTLQEAQARGDGLSADLLTRQAQIDQLKTEKRDAIKQATTGRPCLDGPALRLLHGAPGLGVGDLPPATGGPAAAGEPAGAAGDDAPAWYSSDTQVAAWIVDAGAAFEVCRARLDALIDWHAPTGDLHD